MDKYPTFLKNKYSSGSQEEAIFIIAGVLSRIILTKDYFFANPDLKKFTKNVLGEDYRDYLFANRSSLYSRVLRDIIKEKDEKRQLLKINNILEYINKFEESNNTPDEKKIKKTQKKITKKYYSSNSDIKSWREIINPKE